MDVVVDDREEDLAQSLAILGIDFVVKRIEIGDVTINNYFGIERKRWDDFIASVVDRRLFIQAKNLECFERRLIIVERDGPIFDYHMKTNALIGAMVSVYKKYNCSIVFVKDVDATAYFIERLINQSTEISTGFGNPTKKPDSQFEKTVYLLSSIPHIGPEKARKLATIFKCPMEALHELSSPEIVYGKRNGKPIRLAGKLGETGLFGVKTALDISNFLNNESKM